MVLRWRSRVRVMCCDDDDPVDFLLISDFGTRTTVLEEPIFIRCPPPSKAFFYINSFTRDRLSLLLLSGHFAFIVCSGGASMRQPCPLVCESL